MIKNKRVCLVGPVNYIENIAQKDKIESYDVVIRFIRSLPVSDKLAKNVGIKTNLIISSLIGDRGVCSRKSGWTTVDPQFMNIIKANGNTILVPFPDTYHGHLTTSIVLLKKDYKTVKVITRNKESFDSFWTKLGSRPSTGIAAISHLLSLPLKELYLTGFAFDLKKYKRTKEYLSRVIEIGTGFHDMTKEKKFFVNSARLDPRITMDEHMSNHVMT